METQPTLNSKNFKMVKCPTCEKYPGRYEKSVSHKPHINFKGLRWDCELHIFELQGYCSHCNKEFRVLVLGVDHEQLHKISLYNPKVSDHVGPIEEHLKRWN